ncbi:DEKNAAC104207 [Brettanomyces naardenensis]|uniref:DEKNAAC104207 n=1 Tax=Brettanomyces naardenensis TaxID=13370 RepID=A0A448YPZ4_BRENA|nr:DEKNAAC104207 [Brettanomyces naardenensis]
MPTDDQQDLINYLEVKQRFAWPHLTRDEKRATYYISYGSWGPRNDRRLSSGEVLFKSLTTLFLFGVVAFAVINYKKDEKERSALTERAKEASEASEAPEGSGAAQ